MNMVSFYVHRKSPILLIILICFVTLSILFKSGDESTGRYQYQHIPQTKDHPRNLSTVQTVKKVNVYSTSFHLWSKDADLVDWSSHTAMCDNILSSPHTYNLHFHTAVRWTPPYAHSDQSMVSLLSDCHQFRELVPFPTAPMSKEEAEYPLAYVVVGARNAAQTARLLRMIYQPQNAYCITYDGKSSVEYEEAMRRLVECMPGDNVFLSPHNEVITWGEISILRSEMTCLKLLLDKWTRIPWKYVQIVSWNDLPLRTNTEMVNMFKIFNGSQDCALVKLDAPFFTSRNRSIPPDGLTMYKGSHANSLTKEFVQFVFTNPIALRFYNWSMDVACPEELYFPTLIHNVYLNAPGSFPGQCYHYYNQRHTQKPWVSRYEVWKWNKWKCKGKIVNYSCVFGILDILTLIDQPHLVAHKVYEEFQPALAFCLEQWFWGKHGKASSSFNASYYESFPSVRYEKMKNERNRFVC